LKPEEIEGILERSGFVSDGAQPNRIPGTLSWHGTLQGKRTQVVVRGTTQTRYHGEVRSRVFTGYHVDVTFDIALHNRLTLVNGPAAAAGSLIGWLNRLVLPRLGMTNLPMPWMPEEPGIHPVLHAVNAGWAKQFLALPEVRNAASILLRTETIATFAIQPESITFSTRVSGETLRSDYLARVLAALSVLVSAAERQPRLAQPVMLRPWESWVRKNPGLAVAGLFFGLLAIANILGILLFLAVLILPRKLVPFFGMAFWIVLGWIAYRWIKVRPKVMGR
jgi:hypothetical protein